MHRYTKIGVVFVSAGLIFTGEYLIKTGTDRICADDMVAIMGAAAERQLPYMYGDQTVTNASTVGAVTGAPSYTVTWRPSGHRTVDSLRRLRAEMTEGDPGTPFDTTRDSAFFTHGSILASNVFDSAGSWIGMVTVDSSPRGYPDRIGPGARCCAVELIGQASAGCTPFGLSDADGSRSRWQIATGLTNGLYYCELPASYRFIRRDILAAERAIANSSETFFCPAVPLEILPGSFLVDTTTGRRRHQGNRTQAIASALQDKHETLRVSITSWDQIPTSPHIGVYANQLYREDWAVEIWQTGAYKLRARPLWPSRQAIEDHLVGHIAVYVVLSISWSWECYDDNPGKISSRWLDAVANNELGLDPDILRSPLPVEGMVSPPWSSAEVPIVYLACKISEIINPQAWPLPEFQLDLSDLKLPSRLPGSNSNSSGQLEAHLHVHGIFSTAFFPFRHSIR